MLALLSSYRSCGLDDGTATPMIAGNAGKAPSLAPHKLRMKPRHENKDILINLSFTGLFPARHFLIRIGL
jgi:hypothetical protein